MIFLRGLWHGVKVVATGGYWLLSVYFVWAALLLMGRKLQLGLALLLMVAGLFVARIGLGRVTKSPGLAYVITFAAYAAVFVFMYLTDPISQSLG